MKIIPLIKINIDKYLRIDLVLAQGSEMIYPDIES